MKVTQLTKAVKVFFQINFVVIIQVINDLLNKQLIQTMIDENEIVKVLLSVYIFKSDVFKTRRKQYTNTYMILNMILK